MLKTPEKRGRVTFLSVPSPSMVNHKFNVHIQFIEKLYLLLVSNTKVITSNFRVSFG